MIIARASAGHGLGNLLLDYAATLASRAGRPLHRLDAWRTNGTLIDYYKRRGFTDIPTVEAAHRQSGALFERPVLDGRWVIMLDDTTMAPHRSLSAAGGVTL